MAKAGLLRFPMLPGAGLRRMQRRRFSPADEKEMKSQVGAYIDSRYSEESDQACSHNVSLAPNKD